MTEEEMKAKKKKKCKKKKKKKNLPKNVNWVLTCSICDHRQHIPGEGNYTCPCGAKYSVGKMRTGTGDWQLNIMLMNRDEIVSIE